MKRLYFVYLLRCSDQSFYVGVTNNIDRRLIEHQSGKDVHCFTYQRRPVSLVFCAPYTYIQNAIDREKQLKRWSKQKKEALIRENFNRLEFLSRRRKSWNVPQKIRFTLHRKVKAILRGLMLRDALAEASAPQHDKNSKHIR